MQRVAPIETSTSSSFIKPTLLSSPSFYVKEDAIEALDNANQKLSQKEDSIKISDVIENNRLAVKKFLNAHWLGVMYRYALLVLSVLSSIQYIYQLYLDPTLPEDQIQISVFSLVEEALACLFMFDWCLSFFIADHKINHIMRFDNYLLLKMYT